MKRLTPLPDLARVGNLGGVVSVKCTNTHTRARSHARTHAHTHTHRDKINFVGVP